MIDPSLTDFRFPRQARLIKTDDFSSVFNFRKRISSHFLAIHYRYHGLGHARLGLIVGKKTAKRSVDRNYMKRVLRELFRHHQAQLRSMDIVIRTQKPFNASHYAVVKEEFAGFVSRLAAKQQ